MNEKIGLTLALTLIIGALYFLGSGITGHVISQSCCFAPNCESAENVCDANNQELNAPFNTDNLKVIAGIFLILVSSWITMSIEK